tara:strand:- start:1003 stop:1239 length:237 start_codon:yes stop_codon:yes gene_type:complete
MEKNKVHIAVSMFEVNTFYIFRNDLTEVKCKIDVNRVVRPQNYRLTKKEVTGIRKFFKGISKINVSYKPYSKIKRNKV